jgi:hypothetical protein
MVKTAIEDPPENFEISPLEPIPRIPNPPTPIIELKRMKNLKSMVVTLFKEKISPRVLNFIKI